MTFQDLLDTLDSAGVQLAHRLDDSGTLRLRIDAPTGVLTPEVVAALAQHKPALLKELSAETGMDSPASTGDATAIPEPIAPLVVSPTPTDDTFLKSQDEIREEVAGWPGAWRECWWLLLRDMDGGGFTTCEAERCAYQHTLV